MPDPVIFHCKADGREPIHIDLGTQGGDWKQRSQLVLTLVRRLVLSLDFCLLKEGTNEGCCMTIVTKHTGHHQAHHRCSTHNNSRLGDKQNPVPTLPVTL